METYKTNPRLSTLGTIEIMKVGKFTEEFLENGLAKEWSESQNEDLKSMLAWEVGEGAVSDITER